MSVINYLNRAVRVSAEAERCTRQHASNQDAFSLIDLVGELSLGFPAAALLPQLPSQNVWAFFAVFLLSLQPVGLANSVQP